METWNKNKIQNNSGTKNENTSHIHSKKSVTLLYLLNFNEMF